MFAVLAERSLTGDFRFEDKFIFRLYHELEINSKAIAQLFPMKLQRKTNKHCSQSAPHGINRNRVVTVLLVVGGELINLWPVIVYPCHFSAAM